jgi:isomerase DpgB
LIPIAQGRAVSVLSGNVVSIEIGCDEPLSKALVARVQEFCDRAEDGDGRAGVIRLTGAGADRPWPGDVDVYLVGKWERALRRTERLAAPTVAVATGPCAGPAFDVLLTADHRIAGPDLTLHPPATADGPWPGMFVHRLVNQIGVARARRLILFGGELTAPEAYELGIVDEVSADPDAAVPAAVAAADAVPGSEVAVRRRLVLDAVTVPFEEALGAHLAACDRALRRAAGVHPAHPAVPLVAG